MCIGDGDTGGQGVSWGSSPRNDRHEDGICYQGNTVQHQDKLLMQLHVVFCCICRVRIKWFFLSCSIWNPNSIRIQTLRKCAKHYLKNHNFQIC